jgi:hypothetical protein
LAWDAVGTIEDASRLVSQSCISFLECIDSRETVIVARSAREYCLSI